LISASDRIHSRVGFQAPICLANEWTRNKSFFICYSNDLSLVLHLFKVCVLPLVFENLAPFSDWTDILPNRPNFLTPSTLLATWFGAGYLPKAPGTWGSFFALPFAYGIYWVSGSAGLIIASAIVFALGVWASAAYMSATNTKDPGAIVIDEVAAQWLVLVVAEGDIGLYLVGFVLFRIFDIFKPWPVSWADRTIPGGLGVMVDDLFAALFAAALLYGLGLWMTPS
jgi:phosphatidylglycerophosphatase A